MNRSRMLAALATIAVPISSGAQAPSSAVGLWATEGYGLVLDVRPDSVVSYEVTKVSCIATLRARTTPPPSGALGAFGMPNAPVTFVILRGKTDADARVHLA